MPAIRRATRRSPRSIDRFLNNISISGLSPEQCVLLFSLCHTTNWSAERIALKILEHANVQLAPELIYDQHKRWLGSRGTSDLSDNEIQIMRYALSCAGIEWKGIQKPLGEGLRPIIVKFPQEWNASGGRQPLLEGYTGRFRERVKSQLFAQRRSAAIGLLTNLEEPIIARFGYHVTLLIRDLLKRWFRAVKVRLRNEPHLKSMNITYHGYTRLVNDYVNMFSDSYQELFGRLPENTASPHAELSIRINSTGFGAKVLFCILLADRLNVIGQRRRRKGEKIGFVQVNRSDVPEDARDCPICQDEMGVAKPEGTVEEPLKMVVCCNQILGRDCLKTWLEENSNCPACRHQLLKSFMDKLLRIKEEQDDSEGMGSKENQDPMLNTAAAFPFPRHGGIVVPHLRTSALNSPRDNFVLEG